MGKRIIQQRRGKGSSTYRVRKKASINEKIGYPSRLEGEFKVIKLFVLPGHSAPVAKFLGSDGKTFYNVAAKNIYVGQSISFGGLKVGDISPLGNLKNGTKIFNIEHRKNDGGKFVKTAGNSALILGREKDIVRVAMPSKKEKKFSIDCRATIGVLAGGGMLDKPLLKAGKKHYVMKSKSKLWPRTSAVAMNAIDHPFGSGRGKRVKSKIAKRNAAPGKKVGHLRPRRTGRKKR